MSACNCIHRGHSIVVQICACIRWPRVSICWTQNHSYLLRVFFIDCFATLYVYIRSPSSKLQDPSSKIQAPSSKIQVQALQVLIPSILTRQKNRWTMNRICSLALTWSQLCFVIVGIVRGQWLVISAPFLAMTGFCRWQWWQCDNATVMGM